MKMKRPLVEAFPLRAPRPDEIGPQPDLIPVRPTIDGSLPTDDERRKKAELGRGLLEDWANGGGPTVWDIIPPRTPLPS